MFIGVINKMMLLLPSDSLLIRCACVLIGDASLQAHSPRADASYFPDKSAFLDVGHAVAGAAPLSGKPYQPCKRLVFKP